MCVLLLTPSMTSLPARFLLRPRANISHIHRRRYATNQPRSRHAQWYSDILPSMIPIFLLGSATYLGLELMQLNLAHEKYMDESALQIAELEAEVVTLREKRLAQAPVNSTVPTSGEEIPTSKQRTWRRW